ncbi:hypothetical protein GWK47_035401 [Chionoecetes opilio]|uniref:Uncharacterized protein n=1 Tax=Chionoecetes opilio TaxID=41210 RepID=A0A8J5CNL8_CHIOP|nr:hypothetical protein GWK47_035401 [Chionoecetes opilio]
MNINIPHSGHQLDRYERSNIRPPAHKSPLVLVGTGTRHLHCVTTEKYRSRVPRGYSWGLHIPAQCTCALWNTTSAATSLRCSSESRGLANSGWTEGSAASTDRRTRRWMLSSLLVGEAARDIQERAAYS